MRVYSTHMYLFNCFADQVLKMWTEYNSSIFILGLHRLFKDLVITLSTNKGKAVWKITWVTMGPAPVETVIQKTAFLQFNHQYFYCANRMQNSAKCWQLWSILHSSWSSHTNTSRYPHIIWLGQTCQYLPVWSWTLSSWEHCWRRGESLFPTGQTGQIPESP